MNATLLLILTVFVNFVPYEQMQTECWPVRDGASACWVDNEIIMPALGSVTGRHALDVRIQWHSWRELGKVCDTPACERNGIIQATKAWNPAMEAAIGELIYRQQGWDPLAFNEHALLGHELLHAAGLTHR